MKSLVKLAVIATALFAGAAGAENTNTNLSKMLHDTNANSSQPASVEKMQQDTGKIATFMRMLHDTALAVVRRSPS
ncbi:MAG: hypothetical protein MJA83_02910 [Gammaproteobacteria bacterium]|nr:hypothetical protein [Gammaproteobacteria bacterium]